MPLSLTTRRKEQTLSAKWSTQQHLAQRLNTDVTATNANLFRHHQHSSNYHNPPIRKQKSFIETLHLNKHFLTNHTGRAYLSRGLSAERSHDILVQRSSYPTQVLKKHSFNTTPQNYNRKQNKEASKSGDLINKNITSGEQNNSGGEFFKNTHTLEAWSSNTSILKSLDKELAQLNGVIGKCKYVKVLKDSHTLKDNVNSIIKPKVDSTSKSDTQNAHSIRKQIQTEINKVNLNIVLSHTLISAKEENDCGLSDQEVDEDEGDASDKIIDPYPKMNDNKKTESTPNSLKTTTSSLPARQRRALYHTSRQTTNLGLNNNTTALNSETENTENFNSPPALTAQKRPPLVRAMSAPVRGFNGATKDSTTVLNTKRKSRRRKLNTRNISCDQGSCDVLTAKDLNFDLKSTVNRKVLTRSKSVAPDVVTLVSLISSEGSDSEKDDGSFAPRNSHTGSPNKRAPFLRKTGKSVSFQENYPPSFQFASKEYSHMLRRSSIAPLAQRIKSNRPPTAPPGSIYHITQKFCGGMPATNIELKEEKTCNPEDIKNKENNTLSETMNDKPLQEDLEFPEYVRSLKERECWKLFMKMSAKGVIITYDTVLRGMLTPTEFRQLQKQREFEEAKALKEAEDKGSLEETSKRLPTAVERLKESLLKN